MSSDTYIFHKQPGAKDGPVVFAFHGTGGDESQMLPIAEAIAPGATVIAPRGDVSEYGAARFFRRTGEGIYDMDDLTRATAKMGAFVASERGNNRPVIGVGYSNGANILASVLFAQPDLFDAVILMHPMIPFAPEIAGSLKGKKVLITAGRRDPICPPNLTSRLEAYLVEAAADVVVEWHGGGHELRAEELAAAKQLVAGLEKKGRSMDIEIKREDGPTKGRYFIAAPGGEEPEMTYTKVGDSTIIIDHTGVPDAFRGQGIGAKLVTRAVEDARAAGIKIIPLCPFATAQFERHKDWADVLKR